MIDLTAYPKCAGRLRFQRANLAETGFNAYWAAACVADDFADDALTAFGGFNFDDRSEENGYRQLGLLEQFMAARRKAANTSPAFERKQKQARQSDVERVKAFLGSQGVKSGKIDSIAEFWTVAALLWPGKISKGKNGRIQELHAQIVRIGRKPRASIARENLKSVPVHLLSDAPKHVAKVAA